MTDNAQEAQYWSKRYNEKNTGWDIGYVSTPLKAYIDQLEDKSIRILIPGAGNSYEAEYLWKKGFRNTYVIDLASEPLANLKARVPDFPDAQLLQGDFFDHRGTYDLILEQTFFCAIPRKLRTAYADHMPKLLADAGKLVGVLFGKEMNPDGPPHGGSIEEYASLFAEKMNILIMEDCHNSIPPRAGSELFIIFGKTNDKAL